MLRQTRIRQEERTRNKRSRPTKTINTSRYQTNTRRISNTQRTPKQYQRSHKVPTTARKEPTLRHTRFMPRIPLRLKLHSNRETRTIGTPNSRHKDSTSTNPKEVKTLQIRTKYKYHVDRTTYRTNRLNHSKSQSENYPSSNKHQ